jgi:site-specific DNA-methyltransferase (adenine-specific)
VPLAKPKPAETVSLEPAAEWVPIEKLTPWVKNPRKNDKAVDKIAESIKTFGFGAPLLARKENGEVIAGHTRIKAAKKLGMTRLPVRYMDLDEAKAHALAIADNKLGEIAAWDDALLADVLAEIRDAGVAPETTGVADAEFRKLLELNDSTPDGAALESPPEKLQRKWKTKLGQLWEIPSKTTPGGMHRLACGSSTDANVARRAGGGLECDMMWTDPPYGVAYVGKTDDALRIENDAQSPDELRAFLVECFKAAPLKPGAAWYICHPAGGIHLQFRLATDAVGWVYRQGLVWVKDSMVLGRSDYHYKHEPIIFGYAPGKGRRGRGGAGWHGGNAETSVFDVERPKANELHPTMKPVELVARMVRNSSAPGENVYEPFSGSGSTMLACEITGRLCRAIELDPKYVAVALERMAEVGCNGQLSEA